MNGFSEHASSSVMKSSKAKFSGLLCAGSQFLQRTLLSSSLVCWIAQCTAINAGNKSGLITFCAVIIFYNCVEELLRCFSAVLSQHIQPVIWIFSTALSSSFFSTLGCSSSLLTSFTIPLLSPLNCSSGKQMSVENNFLALLLSVTCSEGWMKPGSDVSSVFGCAPSRTCSETSL